MTRRKVILVPADDEFPDSLPPLALAERREYWENFCWRVNHALTAAGLECDILVSERAWTATQKVGK